MKKLSILILFLACLSVVKAQTYVGVGNTLQRAPTAKGYIYRFSMGVPGFVGWYTNAQIDSLIAHSGGTYTASRGIKLFSNDFRLDTTVIDTLHGLFTRNKISVNGANIFSMPDFQGSRFLVVGNLTPTTSAARISQAESITLNNNGDHSFGAYSDFTISGVPNGSAVATYDSKNRMLGSINAAHFIDFQARNIFQTSANLDHMYAFDASDVHAGSAVINNYMGFHGTDPTVIGGGSITNNYGLYLENIANGTKNYGIYTKLGINRFGDKTGVLIEPVANFDIGTNTNQAGSAVVSYLGRTNETSNYEALELGYIGDVTAANRVYQFQSIEQGVSNSGSITFQPAGGKLFYGTTTVPGNEVAKKSDITTPTLATVTTAGNTTTNGISVGGIVVPSFSTSGVIHNNTSGVFSSSLVGISDLSATGTPSSTTYLRGDNTWASIVGGVSSFNTRTGAVIPVAGDYSALTETLTNKSISGSSNTLSNIGNSSLTNSAITFNGTSTSLGGSFTVTKNNTDTTSTGFATKSSLIPYQTKAQALATFIQNQITAQQTAGFNINGNGVLANMGVNTGLTASLGRFQIVETNTGSTRGILNDQYSTDVIGPRITQRKARGSFASPLTVIAGDFGFNYTGSMYDGSAFVDNARFITNVKGTVSAGIIPSTVSIQNMNGGGVLGTSLFIDTNRNVTNYGVNPMLNLQTTGDSKMASMQRTTTLNTYSQTNYISQPGGIGNAVVSSSTSQFFTGVDTALPNGAGTGITLTVSEWFKTSSGSNYDVINYGNLLIQHLFNSVAIIVGGVNLGGIGYAGNIRDGNWHLMIVAINGTSATLYIDNVAYSFPTLTSYTITLNGTFANSLGVSNQFAMQGTTDQLAIYNRTLSTTSGTGGTNEIATIWNTSIGTQSIPQSGLIRWYKFQTGSGTTAFDSNPNTTQYSVTLTGGMSWAGVGNGHVPQTGTSGDVTYLKNGDGIAANENGRLYIGETTTGLSGVRLYGQTIKHVINNTIPFVQDFTGKVLINTSNTSETPTISAQLTLGAPTATAGTGALKMISGTAPTTGEAGLFGIYDGTNFLVDPSTTHKRLAYYTNSTASASQTLIGDGAGGFTLGTLYNQVVASGDVTAQTAAGNITTYANGASDASFNIAASLNVTAVTTDVIQTQITYTDETNTSRTVIFYPMGTTAPGISTTGAVNYPPMSEVRVKASTTITVATVLTTGVGSITFNAHASITKIR